MRPSIWNYASSLVALIAAAGLPACPAHAQTLRQAIISDGPLPPIKQNTPRKPAPVQAAAEDASPRAMRPAAEPDDVRPGPDFATGDDIPQAAAPAGLRPAARDGAPDADAGPQAPVDGVPEPIEVYENPDGADMTNLDARSPDDAAAFERPPAGYDPNLYATELTTLTDRRVAQLFRFEPYAPRGIRLGTFVAFPTVDVGGAWVSNLFRSATPRADKAIDLRPVLAVRSDWRQHALELRASAGLSYFDQFSSEDDRAYRLEARGRLDITKRSNVTGVVFRDVVQETRGTLEQRLRGGPRADVTTDQGALSFRQTFNRLSVELRGSLTQRTYSDPVTSTGTVISNRDRDLSASEGAVRTAWAFHDMLQGFVEGGGNQRSFEAPSPSDGIRRNSTGERYRVGVNFGTAGQVLRGEASVGYGRQNPDDHRLAAIDGVIIDANVAWRIDADNALLLRAATDVIETSVAGSAGGLSRLVGLEYRHAFLRHLIGVAGLSQTTTDYQGISFSDRLATGGLGLEYFLAPEAMMFATWQHQSYNSPTPGSDWSGDEIRVGMRLRR